MYKTLLSDFRLKGRKLIDLEQEKPVFEIDSVGDFHIHDGRKLTVTESGDVYLMGLHIGKLSKKMVASLKAA